MTRRQRVAAAGVLLVAASVALCTTTAQTDAAWSDTEVGTGSFAAGSVTPVTTMTCTAGLLQPVTYNWTAPAGGLTRTGYRWTVTGALSGSGTLAPAATSVTLSTGLLGLGSGTFSLYAVGPGGWESTAKTGTLSFATVVLDVLSSCSVP
ncbi:hypothetical protein J2X63_001639 [Agromyces sp. 3263]|uniref:hypothetical protein n=1 Tax=Agromyces sp. 3263 TaxID=2817750 RepID=UPI0028627C80|nr:hypothetical protein [Agromyces sp. 3263]MDR6905953.1 hypothetical protein [Agromyces sp. 3263]